jgi:hypothetical protein
MVRFKYMLVNLHTHVAEFARKSHFSKAWRMGHAVPLGVPQLLDFSTITATNDVSSPPSPPNSLSPVAAGEIEYRRGAFDAAFAHLRTSVRLDDDLPFDEPWGWMQPTRHALGALLLEQVWLRHVGSL